MVKDNKGKITYIQNQKEDLAIFRITPEGDVPDYKAGQFLTLGMPVEAEGGKMIRKIKNILNLLFDGSENHIQVD